MIASFAFNLCNNGHSGELVDMVARPSLSSLIYYRQNAKKMALS